ncbi:MAG TPA: hypothetical protein VM694_44145 [Polyangium sp.]|nr:hypothetical protein [Polyangium sp.]
MMYNNMISRLAWVPLFVGLVGCNRDWDAYDPRLGGGGAGAEMGVSSSVSSSSGAGGVGGMGGEGGASSSSSAMGGAGGEGGAGGAGGAPQCTIALKDNFDDGLTDPEKWSNYVEAGASIAESKGNLVVTIESGAPGYAVHYSTQPYDISNCGAFVQVLEVPNKAAKAYAAFQIGTGSDNAVEISFYQGTLYCHKILADNYTDVAFTEYDPIEHAFWRIREEDGNTFWETSPDAQQWTVQASEPNPLPVGEMYVALIGGIDEPAPDPGRVRFDNLNILP